MTQFTDWSLRVGFLGHLAEGLVDIHQAVRLVITTPKGADPHRPDFGCDAWLWLDAPSGKAIPNVIREIKAALDLWEPRALVQGISAEQVKPGWVKVRVTWTADGYEEVTTADLATPDGDDYEYIEDEKSYMPTDFVE